MLNILILKNITREGPGLLEPMLKAEGARLETADLDRGDPLPSAEGYDALIVLGGPDSANDTSAKIESEIRFIREWLETGKPYLGICLGLQLLVKAAGGQVVRAPHKEIGFRDAAAKPYTVRLTDAGRQDPLCAGLSDPVPVLQLHGETVELTPAMTLLGEGEGCRNQMVRAGKNAYGIQCHFEVTRPMLELWAAEDEDLSRLDRHELLQQFDGMESGYAATCKCLAGNFLSIVNSFSLKA